MPSNFSVASDHVRHIYLGRRSSHAAFFTRLRKAWMTIARAGSDDELVLGENLNPHLTVHFSMCTGLSRLRADVRTEKFGAVEVPSMTSRNRTIAQ